jgi:hypothetical protein
VARYAITWSPLEDRFRRKNLSIDGSTPMPGTVRIGHCARVAPINPFALLRSPHRAELTLWRRPGLLRRRLAPPLMWPRGWLPARRTETVPLAGRWCRRGDARRRRKAPRRPGPGVPKRGHRETRAAPMDCHWPAGGAQISQWCPKGPNSKFVSSPGTAFGLRRKCRPTHPEPVSRGSNSVALRDRRESLCLTICPAVIRAGPQPHRRGAPALSSGKWISVPRLPGCPGPGRWRTAGRGGPLTGAGRNSGCPAEPIRAV